MAARTRKPKTPELLQFDAELKKETQGTFMYQETGERIDWISGSIYLKKGQMEAFGENVPQNVRVTIEFLAAE